MNDIIRLRLYRPPEGKVVIPKRVVRKSRLPQILVAVAFLVGFGLGLLIYFKPSIPLPGFLQPQKLPIRYLWKYKYTPPPVDTVKQRMIADSLAKLHQPVFTKQEKIVDSLKLSMRYKRALIDFLSYAHPALGITGVVSMDDEYLFVEGKTKSVEYLDSLIIISLMNGAGAYANIIDTVEERTGIRYVLKVKKKEVERVWDDNYVSIPPYRRAKAVETLDSLRKLSGVGGRLIPLDEENHEVFTRYVVCLYGSGSQKATLNFLRAIDTLNFYAQILSFGANFGQKNILTISLGLNYIPPKSDVNKPESLQTGVQ